MDFKDQIKQLSEKVLKLKDQIQTEEATKMAFVAPFLQCLGFDVFNPSEVVPEFIADIGIKKGEKIDYAIFKDGQPILIVECKHWAEKLDPNTTQLFRYFVVTKTRFALLTNGILYRFYTDLESSNIMDSKPFLEVDISQMKEAHIEELKKFHKSYFDSDNIFDSASELKYSNEIKQVFLTDLKTPSIDLVRYFLNHVYTGIKTEKVITKFTEIVRKTINATINDLISDRLQSAIENEEKKNAEAAPPLPEEKMPVKAEAETTDEELEAFYVIKSILRQKYSSDRIQYKDFLTAFNVFLDSPRKVICKLYTNKGKFILGTFTSEKEEKIEITSIDDIYTYSDKILASASIIESPKSQQQ